MRALLLGGFSLLALAASAATAAATPVSLAPANYLLIGSIDAFPVAFDYSGTQPRTFLSQYSGGELFGLAYGQPVSTISAFADLYGGSVEINMGFQVEIVGPADVDVPVIVGGAVSTSVQGGSPAAPDVADAEVSIAYTHRLLAGGFANDVYTFLGESCSYNCDTFVSGGVLNAKINAVSNTIINVSLIANAVNGFDYNSAESAAVDPYFTIDPSFPLANEFSIIISPNVGNSAPNSVAEPNSFALLGAALIGLGMVCRCNGDNRRRSRPGR